MARGSFRAGRPDDLAKWFRGKVLSLEEASGEALEEAAKSGEEYVIHNISTRGTANQWQGDWSRFANSWPGRTESSPGRVASGGMIDAVSSWVSHKGADNKARMAFGWTNPSTRKEYFMNQEAGFSHSITGGSVDGMYAIIDAGEAVFSELQDRMDGVIRDA